MDDPLSYILIAFLLLVAFYCAVTETAFASVSRIKIKAGVDRGDKRALRAMKVIDQFESAITTLLIITNIAHLAAASYVTLLVSRKWGVSAVAVSTVVTTVVLFFFAEMFPKSLAKKYSERFALATAASLCFFMRIFAPVSRVLGAVGSAASKLTKGDQELTVTEDELYDIIENMRDEGELGERSGLIRSALMFGDVTVESILTARVDLDAVNVEDSTENIVALIKRVKHSRLPVYRGSIDNIIGVLQIRKYIKAYLKEGKSVRIEPLMDEAYFIHQSTNIDELLPEMSRKKLNMAIVTDNYGGTLGIVTIEDMLEELVGEIWDEDDEVVEIFIENSDGSAELSAELDIEGAFEMFDYEDPEDRDWEHKLLSEWAYEQFELLPREGDSFRYHDLEITISGMHQHRITRLTFRVDSTASKGGAEE